MNKILIHPSYFPSIESMAWILKAKEVVLESCDNYQKQTYRNRCYIAHSNGVLALNVPIRHTKDGQRQKTAQVVTEDNFPWKRDHWRSIQTAYRTSPYFEFYEDELAPLYQQAPASLFEFNKAVLETLLELLQVETQLSFTKSYEVQPELLLDKRNLVNCKRTTKVNFDTYHQVFGSSHGFLPNLCILDLLFNEGPNSVTYLEQLKLD